MSIVTSFETVEANDNPISESTSVSEFWGQRWNRVVGDLLRVGIYRPGLKLGLSKQAAIVATFFVSGLYHEYVMIVFGKTGYHEGYKPNYAAQLLFFLWNGLLLLAESSLCKLGFFNKVSSKMPKRAKNIFVLMSVLPISHWFLNEYVSVGLFGDFGVAFPLVRKIQM
mmetsp:Transcript_102960/g.297691  ORF Transcript_102960/g.297691 Transcript_102960/m.297691 type:complete len:168 (+) Transcript_102960:874-1377(+)